MKQRAQHTFLAPRRVIGREGELAIERAPAVIDSTRDQLLIPRDANRCERTKVSFAKRQRKQVTNEFRYVPVTTEDQLQASPPGFMIMFDDRQLTLWAFNEARNRIEAE